MRALSKFTLGCAAAMTLVLAGCGSSSSSQSAPERVEASYFPAGSPLMIAVATDPSSPGIQGVDALAGKFPLAALGEAAIKSKLSSLGIDYDTDLRPLFGNPILVGALGSDFTAVRSRILGVWITRDAGKLTALLKKIPGLHPAGSHDGATEYQAGTSYAAQQDATLLVAPSASLLNAALDRHASGKGGAQVPASTPAAVLTIFGSLQGVLAAPSAAKARAVPWVAALKGYSAAVSASSSGLTFTYHFDTSARTLTADQVPLAQASGTPQFAGNDPITVSVLDPAHIVSWALSVQRATSPAAYARFQARQARLRARTGVDLTNLIQQLNGDLIVSSDTHSTLVRVGLGDPGVSAADLGKLLKAPRSLFTQPATVTSLGGGFYRLDEGKVSVTLGVTGDQLALGEASRAAGSPPSVEALRAFASAPTTPAPGARGPVAFRVGLPALLALALKHQPSATLGQVLHVLGDVTGWTSASTSALDGSASLGLG